MHIQTDRSRIPAHAFSIRYLHVTITAPPATPTGAAPRPPADVALVLDRSGSMGGRKIEMARAAVDHAIQLLQPQDHLTVVCYDNEVDTVLSRTAASKEAKTLARERLAEIDARGSTDLAGGWSRGGNELRAGMAGTGTMAGESAGHDAGHNAGHGPDPAGKGPVPAVRRVLLLTDGLANHGVTDHDDLAALAAQLRTAGISTSTFGLGADFDEALLARLAREGGGHFYFVELPTQIPDFLASELGETLQVVARDVTFEVACRAKAMTPVELALLNDLPADAQPDRLRVRLGDLVADQEVSLVVAVCVPSAPAAGDGVDVDCRVIDRDQVFAPQPMSVEWTAVDAAANGQQAVNAAVIVAAARLLAANARTQALAANRQGDFRRAQRILAKAARALTDMAPDDPAVVALADGLRHEEHDFARAMRPVDMKRRHFSNYIISGSREPEGQARRRPRSGPEVS